MAHRKSLNERQLEILRWINAGCPDDDKVDVSRRITAAALRSRGLVTVRGRGPTWSATITDKGRLFLEDADRSDGVPLRQGNYSVTEKLVADVIAAGGSLEVDRPRYGSRGIDYEKRVLAAERHRKVPTGQRLVVTFASDTKVRIDLVDGVPGTPSGLTTVAVRTSAPRGGYHVAVRRFADAAVRHDLTRAVIPRVLRILQAVVVEAERRGHCVTSEVAPKATDTYQARQFVPGRIVITADGCTNTVTIREIGLPRLSYWEQRNRTYSYTRAGGSVSHLPPRTAYEAAGTGRLEISISSNYWCKGRQTRWSDGKRAALVDKLAEMLREIELRASEFRNRQIEAQRLADERHHAWEHAMHIARERHTEQRRAQHLLDQVERWGQAQQIRDFCNATTKRFTRESSTAEWIEWARRYADSIDALSSPPEPPMIDDEIPPRELEPFLDGWSPYGPDSRQSFFG